MILQIVSLVMLSSYSKSHQTFFGGMTNQVIGDINTRYNNWSYFFRLKKTNTLLAAENVALRNQLAQNFIPFDTTKKLGTLILRKDSLEKTRKFYYYPAKVVGNTFTLQKNYITIERGGLQGVEKEMAAISPDGSIVGIVIEVNDNYSKIMSLLHRNSKVSAMLKRDKVAGTVEWDGSDPDILTLKNISKSAAPKIGDSVLTSPYSASFPAQLMLGRVTKVLVDPSSNFLTLELKSATNFYNLEFIYLVENKRMNEQLEVEKNKTPNE
ncbi:MAG: rod shape-determining protein MreC [Sediminibacterium sp.]|nr:rod shape-determining protein MreC [Sediminibacterium sp.]